LRLQDVGVQPSLLIRESAEFERGVLVLPVFLAKGLEFDAVVIADVSTAQYSAKYDRRLLYVACSRALHKLDLICSGDLSPFVKSLPAELYELEAGLGS
jgi:DNA helicase-2/ATP-dependent DNA helicase PcrA